MSKIGRNDLCPCGSGKKYKNCCGDPKITINKDASRKQRSALQPEDFVIERLNEDIKFLVSALQVIIGPYGYRFCENLISSAPEGEAVNVAAIVEEDAFNIYNTAKEDHQNIVKKLPFAGELPREQNDLISLLKRGCISVKGYQVDIFHEYLMTNLKKRFNDYYYLPNEDIAKERTFGTFARRGFDFLVGISLYLELQLGVHVYFDIMLKNSEVLEPYKQSFCNFFGYDIDMGSGLVRFLAGYADAIMHIEKEYKPLQEFENYHSIGAYTEDEYRDRKNFMENGYDSSLLKNDYVSYIKHLIIATITNDTDAYTNANLAFPQCDFIKYLFGIETILQLFEEKVENQNIHMDMLSDHVKSLVMENGGEIGTATVTRKNVYDTAVFYWMDELNGFSNHILSNDFEYIDFPDDINADEYKAEDGGRYINPARRTTRHMRPRRLIMELYYVLNGRCLALKMGPKPGDYKEMYLAGKYPILPWVGDGREKNMIHIKPFDKTAMTWEQLWSYDIQARQEYLNMEYRLTAIPVNYIAEYLDPEAFYNWEKRNELLKELKKQNIKLEESNENLKKQIATNQKLVRNIAHSAANYLNSERLEKTGTLLHSAVIGAPTLDELHTDGLFLMLQSEQERYLTRQLKGLVGKYQSELTEAERRRKADLLELDLRSSITRAEGLEVYEVIGFALKTVSARVLFSQSDGKGKLIRDKLKKSDIEWTNSTSSFITDVLARDMEKASVIEWWKKNWTEISINTSDIWEKIRIVKNGAFFDLITQIISELVINALSHGDIEEAIELELGQENSERGRPIWAYICCRNKVCNNNNITGVGLSSMEGDISILNRGRRTIETRSEAKIFETKVWLDRRFFLARG